METLNFLKKVGKGATIIFLGIILSKLLTYAFRAVIARSFGVSSYGLLILAVSIMSFLSSVIVLGLPQGLLRYIAFYLGKSKNEAIAPLIGSVVRVVVPISLVFGVLFFIFAEKISVFLFSKPELALFLKFSIVLIPALVVYNLLDYVLQAFQDAKSLVLAKNIIDPVGKLLLLVFVILFWKHESGTIFAYTSGIVLAAITMAILLKKKVLNFSTIFFKSTPLQKEMISYSLPLLFNNFSVMIFGWADIILIGVFLPSADVGIYDAALVTSRLLTIAPLAISTMFMPAITEAFANNSSNIKQFYKDINRWMLILLLPMLSFLAIFSKVMLASFFGPAFEGGNVSLILLLFAEVFWGIGLLSSNVLAMLKRTNLIFLNTTISAVLNIILNLILIPKIGIVGAAIATMVSTFSFMVSNLFGVTHYIGVTPFDRYLIKLLLSIAAPIFLMVIIFGKFIIVLPMYNALVIGVLFSLVYIFLLFVTKSFSSEDVLIFKSALGKYGSIKKVADAIQIKK